MSTALDDIIAHKRVEVARAKMNTPRSTLEAVVAQAEPPRNFFAAVVSDPPRPTTRVIADQEAEPLRRRHPR